MSAEITVSFEVRDMLILKETLKQLNYEFTQPSDNVACISRSYHDIVIDGNKGSISMDDMDTSMVNQIKQTYMLNYYRDQAIKEGMQIQEETKADGSIEVHLINP